MPSAVMKGLAARRFTEYPVTSVFLELRPRRTRRPGLVFLKKELALLKKSVPPRSAEARDVALDIRRIEEAAEEARRKKANQLAVFTSAKGDFFEKFFWTLAPEVDLRLPNIFVRGARPHLHPLALFADRLENFLLLVAGLRKGELFKIEGGQIAGRWEKEMAPSPEARREKGGAYDRRTGNTHTTFTKRVEGHLKTQEEKFFDELAGQTAAWTKTDGIRTVILGADSVAGPPVRQKILEQNGRLEVVLAPIDAKLSPACKLVSGVQAFRKAEREISEKRVAELFAPGRRQAIFGPREVLESLRKLKRGVFLVLDEALRQFLPLCGRCSAPAPAAGACPECGGSVASASLENELVCLAAAGGAEIEFVKDSEALAKKGGAGLLV